jgi:hypothetical protein
MKFISGSGIHFCWGEKSEITFDRETAHRKFSLLAVLKLLVGFFFEKHQ